MKRKFDIGDLVIINDKTLAYGRYMMEKHSPLRVGEVKTITTYGNRNRTLYVVKYMREYIAAFHSWELDLVSKKDE